MRILEQIQANMDRIVTIGVEARADARRRGISSFYSDPRYPGYMVEEKPDGSINLVPRTEGKMDIDAAE